MENHKDLKVAAVIFISTAIRQKFGMRCRRRFFLRFTKRIDNYLLGAANLTATEWTRHAV